MRVPSQVPLVALSVESTVTVPEIAGTTVLEADWSTTSVVTCEYDVVLAMLFVAVTASRRNLPASSEVATYEVDVAPEILVKVPFDESERCQLYE